MKRRLFLQDLRCYRLYEILPLFKWKVIWWAKGWRREIRSGHKLLSPRDPNLLNLPPESAVIYILLPAALVTPKWFSRRVVYRSVCTQLSASFVPHLLQFSIKLLKITIGNFTYYLNIFAPKHYCNKCWLVVLSNTLSKIAQLVLVMTKPSVCCALQIASSEKGIRIQGLTYSKELFFTSVYHEISKNGLRDPKDLWLFKFLQVFRLLSFWILSYLET